MRRPSLLFCSRFRSLAALGVIILPVLISSCRRETAPKSAAGSAPEFLNQPPEKPIVDPKASPRVQELQKRLLALYPQTLAEWEGSRADRAQLVRPAPGGFKPTAEGRRLKLTLELAKTTLKAGERLWYRVEMQNVGTEPISVTDPIFKHPEWINSNVKFYLTAPGAAEQMVTPLLFQDPDDDLSYDFGDEEILTPQKLSEARRGQWETFKNHPVRVLLLPGETVFTKPYPPAKGAPPSVLGGYHRLKTDMSFKAPGEYRIRAVYAEYKPDKPDEGFIKKVEARGIDRKSVMEAYARDLRAWIPPFESNSASFTVVP